MSNIEQYIHFDNEKLVSIGFTKKTIIELIEKFSEYLIKLEFEFNDLSEKEIQNDYLLKILHKLEGSSQYLALSGPIKYINIIRHSFEYDSNIKKTHLIFNLFQITHQTINELKKIYGD